MRRRRTAPKTGPGAVPSRLEEDRACGPASWLRWYTQLCECLMPLPRFPLRRESPTAA
ncbi:hypothetical protein XA26_10990 [Mycolicibacterium fortuitum]|uniref:Uncharacterized protein n=1 Tax=Mycolicibacterium fortuitum TaxID=1766 RepID=A0A0N9Y6H1_MYCFO|nr:hypothetical protein G155_00076 [Mycobacterium sp. VKM Ac-1817D]ALI24952.1 hypothetical protein XA26_10990 [Mycolicibacterium fortuitum]